VGGGCFEPPA